MTSEELRAFLHEKESKPPEETLRDIFNYIDNEGSPGIFITPNQHPGDEAGWGTTGQIEMVDDPNQFHGTDGSGGKTPQYIGGNSQIGNALTIQSNNNNNEGSGGYNFEIDDTKVPQTAFGGVNSVAPVNPHTNLINPGLTLDDPNYGSITPAQNVKPDQFNTYATAAMMAAAMGAFGFIAPVAGIGSQIVQLTQALSNGANPANLIINALSSQIPGLAGLSGWQAQLVNAGINALINGGKLNPQTLAMILARAGINAVTNTGGTGKP